MALTTKPLVCILIVCLYILETSTVTFNELPVDVALQMGDTAQFNCSITCTASDICNGLTWSERVTSPTGTDVDIYYGNVKQFNPNHPNKDRYSIAPGTTNLRIHNVKKTDAGRYICKPNQGAIDDTTKFAFLTSLENSTCESHSTAIEGGSASVVCIIKYNKSPDAGNVKIPSLMWDIPGATQTSAVGVNEITMTANFTVTSADNGRRYTCSTFYAIPPPTFTDTCTTQVDVHFGPKNLSITTNAIGGWTNIKPAEAVTCSATGNPGPRYEWKKLAGSGSDASIDGPTLTVIPKMGGNNTYMCKASNTVNGKEKTATQNITFLVSGTWNPFHQSSKYCVLSVILVLITVCNLREK